MLSDNKLSCQYFQNHSCRSCSLLDLSPREIQEFKVESLIKQVTSTLEPFHLDGLELKEIFSPKALFGSRAKAKLSVSGEYDSPVIGILDSDLKGVELESCPLHLPEINELLEVIKKAVSKFKLQPYNIQKKEGELKVLIIKASGRVGCRKQMLPELSLRFVSRSADLKKSFILASEFLQKEVPSLKSVSLNIQPVPHQILEGEEEVFLTKKEVLWENFGEIELAYFPQSFMQVTPETAKALYQYVGSLVKEDSKTLLDLFSGVGGFSVFTGARLHNIKIKGAELSKSSIEAAKITAKKFGLNAEYFAEDVDKFLNGCLSKEEKFDTVIMNPPRRGVSSQVIDFLKQTRPKQILYSSCSPETLLRDINLLAPEFKLKNLKPFEMFPLTKHLEVVGELELL